MNRCCRVGLFLLLLVGGWQMRGYAHGGHEAAPRVVITDDEKSRGTQWEGKRVAFLGDSMTDPNNTSTEAWYWQYLHELLGIEYCVYARSGYQWNGILKKARQMAEEQGDSIDAVIIWAGTNDYNHSVPIGEFYTETSDSVNVDGRMEVRRHRTFVMDERTFCGRINQVMSFLKSRYPTQQIIVVTPIHRAFATFKATNVQPDENYANGQGLYLETYVETLKRAGTLWSVPVIDLHAVGGLFPLQDEYVRYFHHAGTDRLHPNALGHYRIARTLQYQLLALPGRF